MAFIWNLCGRWAWPWNQANPDEHSDVSGESSSHHTPDQRAEVAQRPIRTAGPSRRVREVQLGVYLPDGRQTTGDPVEDYIILLVEAVDRFTAREDLKTELDSHERWMADAHRRMDEFATWIAVLEPKLSVIPDLREHIDRCIVNRDAAALQFEEERRDYDTLKSTIARANDLFERLMSLIYEFSDFFAAARDKTSHVKEVQMDGVFWTLLKLAKYNLGKIRKSEIECRSAESAWKEAHALAQRAKAASLVSPVRSPRSARNAVQYSESVKAMLWREWQSAKRILTIRRKNQHCREMAMLKTFAYEQLVACGRLKIPQGVGIEVAEAVAEDLPTLLSGEGSEPVASPPPGRFSIEESVPSDDLESLHGSTVPEEVHEWRRLRKEVANARRELDDFRQWYTNELAVSIWSFPEWTQEECDYNILQGFQEDPHETEQGFKDRLNELEVAYETAKRTAGDAGFTALLLSPDWAASQTSDGRAGSWSEDHMQAANASEKAENIRRWLHVSLRSPKSSRFDARPAPDHNLRVRPDSSMVDSELRSPNLSRSERLRRHKAHMKKLRRRRIESGQEPGELQLHSGT